MKNIARKPGENARAFALRVLQDNIVTLELPPGTAISENETAEILSLSRTPVREALIELSKLGLVEIVPQKGSYVTKIDYGVIDDIRFTREVLEVAVARVACNEISEIQLKELSLNLDKQKASLEENDLDRFFELDNEFHLLIFQAAHRERVFGFLRSQMVHFDRLRFLSLKSVNHQKTIEDHENLIYALSRHDDDLVEMMIRRHLNRHQFEKDALTELYGEYFTQ